jgi:hypothetical protein
MIKDSITGSDRARRPPRARLGVKPDSVVVEEEGFAPEYSPVLHRRTGAALIDPPSAAPLCISLWCYPGYLQVRPAQRARKLGTPQPM